MIYIGTREYEYNGMKMSHMVADTIQELHAMAERIGVSRRFFQNKDNKPHYDICLLKKKAALKKGAQVVDDREIVKVLRKNLPIIKRTHAKSLWR